jgi:hypothetical protein
MPRFKGPPQKKTILNFFTKANKAEPSQNPAASEETSGINQATTLSADKPGPLEIDPLKREKRKWDDQDVDDEYDLDGTHAALFDEFGDQDVSVDTPKGCEEIQTSDPDDQYQSDEEDVAICPFEPLDFYVCPFKILGQCKRSETFQTMKACALHVHKADPRHTIKTVDQDPLEDGTMKVPCQRLCGQMFARYSSAIYHTKLNCTVAPSSDYPKPCPWNDFGIGCIEISISARAAATHAGAHVRDPRGPYRCHLCGQYWADLYLLSSHITRCKGTGRAGYSRSCLRVELEVGEKQPTTMFIARSSDGTPKNWFAGHEQINDGLPHWAADKLADYKLDLGFAEGKLPAILHAGSAVQTRHLPAPKENNATESTTTSMQTQLARSWKFTNGIELDIRKMAAVFPDCKPTIVSIGIDGLACQVSLILPFLKRVPRFTWVIRETELCYGMSEEVFTCHKSGLYYGVFDSFDLITGIEARLSTNEAVDEALGVKDNVKHLIKVWERLQSLKDNCRDLKKGRYIGRNGDHRKNRRPDMKESKLRKFLSGS